MWKQTNLIFDLIYKKLKVNLFAIGLDIRVRWVAAKEKAKLKQELMVKKLEARVAAIVAIVVALVAAPQRRLLTEKDNKTYEVSPKVMSITFCFVGLSKKKIIHIFHNKFKLINLYRLRHMQRLCFDSI